MSNKIPFLFIALLTVLSCKKEAPVLLTSESFSEEFTGKGNCKEDDCAKVTVDYIKILGNKEIVDKINFTIGNSIIYFLKPDDEKNIRATVISEAADLFIKRSENDKKEFPEMNSYVAELSLSNSYTSSEILSVKTEFYNYIGGAHGNRITNFLNFDPLTGNLLGISAVVKDKKEFTKFAETLFRNKNNIPENEPINSTGFWFGNDKFHLPESIGFSNKGIILLYNQYEIASYSEGPIEVTIPWEKASPFLILK